MELQERVPKIVYQLQFLCEGQQAFRLAWAVLLSLGFKEEELVSSESADTRTFELFDEQEKKLKAVKGLFDRLGFSGVKVCQRRLRPKDWLLRWKSQWKPAALTKKLDVVPVWYRDKYKPRRGRDYILMDTLLSFGTGLHETTRFLAQYIEDHGGKFKSFLDIGTGTGILALVALKSGCQKATAIDIGELSVQAARDNMKVNLLPFDVTKADIERYRFKKTFDFVAANLITEDLIKHARKILGLVKEGGLLGVSGVSLENFDRFQLAFSSLPLKCLKISKGKQWTALLYQKKML